MTEERTDESEITDDLIKKFEGTKQLAQKHFYFLIGLSITAWSSMEGFLVHVAAMLLDTDPKKAGLVLYSTGFHSWLSIISDLFNLDPSYHPLRSDWNKIEKKLKGLNDVRVQVAHHSAVDSAMVLEDVVASGDTKGIFPILKANKFDTRPKTQKREALRQAELVTFIKDVGRVVDAIKTLSGQMTPIYREQKKAMIEEIIRLQRGKEP
jgi:uncharacterized protein (UPF0335 family)